MRYDWSKWVWLESGDQLKVFRPLGRKMSMSINPMVGDLGRLTLCKADMLALGELLVERAKEMK